MKHSSPVALLPLLFAACAPEPERPPETEGRPDWQVDAELARGARIVQDGGMVDLDWGARSERLTEHAAGKPAISADGTRLALAHHDGATALSVLDAIEIGPTLTRRRLVSEGSPDRAAMDAQGEWVVYVSGITGIASVWAIPFEGGNAVQLTNLGLTLADHEPGQPPVGFVAPPHHGALAVEGDRVVWDAPDGPHVVALP